MDEEVVIHVLLKKAIEFAKEERVHLVDTMGFPKYIQDCFLSTTPFHRNNSVPLFWYYTNDKKLAEELLRPDSWYPTPFDGDSSL